MSPDFWISAQALDMGSGEVTYFEVGKWGVYYLSTDQ
jgi:hypothetical protein